MPNKKANPQFTTCQEWQEWQMPKEDKHLISQALWQVVNQELAFYIYILLIRMCPIRSGAFPACPERSRGEGEITKFSQYTNLS